MTVEIRKGYDFKTLLPKNFYFINDFLRVSPQILQPYIVRVKYGIINLQARIKWCVMSKF